MQNVEDLKTRQIKEKAMQKAKDLKTSQIKGGENNAEF